MDVSLHFTDTRYYTSLSLVLQQAARSFCAYVCLILRDPSSTTYCTRYLVCPYAFQPLYTILAPYFSPFLSSIWLFHASTLQAFTNRLGSTQNALLALRAGRPATSGTSMNLPV